MIINEFSGLLILEQLRESLKISLLNFKIQFLIIYIYTWEV